jgi:DNA-dependent RNA polymerase auxiliary subunit epsilon
MIPSYSARHNQAGKRESVDILYPGDQTLKQTVRNLLASECYKAMYIGTRYLQAFWPAGAA